MVGSVNLVQSDIFKFITIFVETAMGTRVNSIEGQQSPIVEAIESLCNLIPERAFSVFKRIDVFFKMTPYYKQQRKALNTLRIELAQVNSEIE